MSTLQSVLHFDDDDLAANRAGQLSERQRTGVERLLMRYYGVLTANIALLLLLLGLGLVNPFGVGWLAAIPMALFAYFFYISWQQMTGLRAAISGEHPVQQVGGPAHHGPDMRMTVGDAAFYLTTPQRRAFTEGAPYQVYFLQQGRMAGILSAEPLDEAPE